VVVENGDTLINCLACIDLNSIHVGLVDRPEDKDSLYDSLKGPQIFRKVKGRFL